MEDSTLVISNHAKEVIKRLLALDEEANPRITLELTLRDSQGFSLRAFANYLEQIDRFYGRLAVGSLRSYSRSDRRLKFNTIYQAESFEIVLEIIDALDNGSAAILLAWFLARLPKIAEAIPNAYKTVQEAKLIKIQRTDIEARLTREAKEADKKEELSALAATDQAKVARTLRDFEIYEQLDEDTRTEITAALPAVLIKEIRMNSAGVRRAYVYNGMHLEKVVLVIRPARFDPTSDDPRIRTGQILRIEIPVVKDYDGDDGDGAV